MARIHIWGGGPYHPTRAQAALLGERLRPLGHELLYGDDRSVFDPGRLSGADLLILMGLDWSGVTKVAPEAWVEPQPIPTSYEPLSDEHFGAIRAHLDAGKPLLCHHSALLSFDERPELAEMFDGRWIGGQSSHPPYRQFPVRVRESDHPAVAGLEDFETSDEIYINLVEPRRSEVLLEAEHDGRLWPLAWAGSYGESKVFVSALGHDVGSYANPNLREFLTRGVTWLLAV